MNRSWLARGSLFVLLALVVARACMFEALRDAFQIVPGSDAVPHGTGPAVSVALDWLCCAAALMTLARGRVRLAWAHGFLLAVALLAMASAIWGDDKFASLVQGFHLVAAAAVFFAVSQSVRSWQQLRLLAAIGFGLLLVCTANGVYYRLVELPVLRQEWEKERPQFLKDHNWDEKSYEARQFALRIENGAMMGFNSSPNSFAAVIVLLTIISTGILIQRIADKDAAILVVPIALAIPISLVVLYFTQSKAAFATLGLAGLLLAALAILRQQLAVRSQALFWAGVGVVLIGFAMAVGHGLYHHSLPGSSLDFRWKYWVGSARLFVTRPLLGVGWDNFGLHYLAYRLPEAPEEIKDPHNFLVRFFVELGAVGGVLAIGWMLTMWWRLTRPVTPVEKDAEKSFSIVAPLMYLSGAALLLNIVFSIDLNQNGAFVSIEVVKRLLFFCLFLIGTVLASVRSVEQHQADDRPAPWILYALLVGLGLFLIHNLIEFSLFEPGPMTLFALLAGAVMGVRMNRREHAGMPVAIIGGIGVTILIASMMLVVPVIRAESQAQRGDDELRAKHLAAAVSALNEASAIAPYNADYALRSVMAMIYANESPDRIREMLQKARTANPSYIMAYLTHARFELSERGGQLSGVEGDFDKALELNPNDVDVRLEYAAALERLGKSKEARQQYELALGYNDKLDPQETKRLSKERISAIQRSIDALKGR